MKVLGETSKRPATRSSTLREKLEAAKAREEEEKRREADLYGDLIGDVRFLRQRGFAITRVGEGFDLGHRTLDATGLRALADRERLLLGEPKAAEPSPLPVFKVSPPKPRAVPRGEATSIDRPPAPVPAARRESMAKTGRGGSTKTAEKAEAKLAGPGPKPRLGWLKLADLRVDSRYQRNVKKEGRAGVNRMAKDFSWRRFTPLVVAPIDGSSFAVVDGQHRLLAARKRGDIPELPCYIIDAADVADQAGSFVSINRDRIQVGRLDQFHASIAARDGGALAIEKICKAAGITVSRVNHPTLPPATATMTLAKMLKLVGEPKLVEALQLLRKAKPETPDAFRSAPIAAMARLVGLYDEKLDRKRLVATLEEFDLDDELAKAKGYRAAAGGTLEDALLLVLVRAYNKRGRAGALQEPQTLTLKAAA